jgi:hypothetical protein
MSCRHATDLKALVDGELPSMRRTLLTRHVARCPDCQKELHAMKRLAETLAATRPDTVLPDALRERLLAAAPVAVPSPRMPLWRREPRLVFGTGTAALVIGGAAFLALTPNRPDASSPVTGITSREFSPVAPSSAAAGETRDDVATRKAPAPALKRIAAKSEDARSAASPVRTQEAFGVRQVFRSGEIAVGVAPGTIEARSDAVTQAATRAGGYVASSSIATGENDLRVASISLRVPVVAFEATLSQIARLGFVTSKQVGAQDLTDSIAAQRASERDLVRAVDAAQARIEKARTERTQLRGEDSLDALLQNLAQSRAQLAALRTQASFAQINVTLQERATPAPVRKASFLDGFSDTAQQANAAFQAAIRVPVVCAIWILAFSPLWVPLIFLYRWADRRRALS